MPTMVDAQIGTLLSEGADRVCNWKPGPGRLYPPEECFP